MRTHYIYLATDKTNGKSYVGQTVNFHERRAEHERCRPSDDCIFHRAIAKHGKENFEWRILDKARSKDEANSLEKFYIETHNTYKPHGYNMTKGGDGGSMWNARPVVCLDLDGTYIRRYDSAGEAKRIDGFPDSDVLLCCKGLQSHSHGKQFMFEDEYLERGATIYKKPEPSCMKPIIQCDLNGNFISKYKSVKEAAEQTKVGRTRISSALIGCCKTAGGFVWVYEQDFPIEDISEFSARKKGRKVAQVDIKTGEIIKVFDRIADAGRELGVNYKAIHKVVDMPDRTAYGFKWISQ